MGLLKKLAGDTALYGLSSIVGRLLNYLLVPLYTQVFATGEYGVVTELYAYTAFLNIIYVYGLETTFFRFAHKQLNEVYNLLLTNILLTTLVFSGILIAFSQPISVWMGYAEQQKLIIWLICIISIDAILVIPYARLRQENKAKLFAFTKIANILLTIGLNLFFLVLCKDIHEGKYLVSFQPLVNSIYSPELGVGYVFLSNLIANAAVFILLYRSFLSFHFYWNWKELKPIIIYTSPILFTGLAAMVNTMLDKIMISRFLPDNFYAGKTALDAVGIYGAAQKISIFMMVTIQAFRYAAEPFFFSQAEKRDAPEVFAKVMRYFIIIGVLITIGVVSHLDILKILFLRRPEYREGIIVVPILLYANLFLGIYYNLSVWYKLTDRTIYGTWITLVGAIITIVGNVLLIPILGYVGSAFTTLVAYSLMVVIAYYLGQKFFPIPYQLLSAFSHLLIGGVLTSLAYLNYVEHIFLDYLIKVCFLILYFGFIFLTERKNISLKGLRKS